MATKPKTQQELDEEEKKKAQQAAATPELPVVDLVNANSPRPLPTVTSPNAATPKPPEIPMVTSADVPLSGAGSTTPVVPLSDTGSTPVPAFRTGVSSTTPAMAMLQPAAEAVARPAAAAAAAAASTPAPAPAPAAPAPVATPPTGSILPDVLSERTQDIGKSVDQKFTDKLAEDKKAAQAAQDARIANLQTIQTPYGAIKATPEQAARYNKSPEMVQLEIDALKKAPYGGKPLTDEERKNLPPAEFDRRVKEASAPITRAEMDNREARIRELENKRNRLAGEARDERYLTNIQTLRDNRQKEMERSKREDFPQTKKGEQQWKAYWDSIPSVMDQTSAVSPAYTGKSNQEVPAWFQSRLDSFQPMSGGGAGSDEVAREVDRMRRAETAARQRSMGRRVTSAGATRKSSTKELQDRAVSAIAGKRRVAEATQEARFTEEEAQQANRDLIKKYNEVAPEMKKEDVQDMIDKLGPERAQSFLEKLRTKSAVGRQK